MVMSCAAPDCKERFRRNGPTFHRFPLTKENLLKEWVAAIKREGFEPNKNSYLCARHFRSEDYEAGCRLRNRLKPNAVPCLFSSSDMRENNVNVRKRVRKRKKMKEDAAQMRLCVAAVALDHPYSVISSEQSEPETVTLVHKTAQKKIKAAKQRLRKRKRKTEDTEDEYSSNNQSPDGSCEMLNPWQSRVIEACFLVPVICDLEEKDYPYNDFETITP